MAKFVLCLCLCLALALAVSQAQPQAAVTESPIMAEQSTESPIADMALIEDAPMAPKSPTEKPPVVVVEAMEQPKADEPKAAAQPHTVADFIIHPLIAFKPRQAAFDELQGKQSGNAGASPSPASPGTWLFGMNPAQGLGSSFSTLAGSVSGWFNDRLAAAGQQLPGLVDTPVRESTTTSSTTSSTTTQRPDIVVRVQQRPQRGQRPANGNGNGNRRQRPNRFNDRPNNSNNRLDDSFEDDYYDEDDYFQGNRFDEEFDDEEADDLALNDEQSLEQFDEEDDEQQSVEQQQQKRRPQQQQKRRKSQQAAGSSSQRKKVQEAAAAAAPPAVEPTKRRQQQQAQSKPQDDDDEDIEDDDDEEEDSIDDDSDEEEEQQQQFAAQPETEFFVQSGTRRSQNQANFIQRGQQSLISQIRQFTRGQSPAELGTKLRRTSQSGGSSASLKARRPQQTTLLVNRNGQTLYVAPELLNLGPGYPYAYVPSQAKKQRVPVSAYPQPPLTVPIRRQGRPTQYITIPWSQLGLSPPDQQSMVSLAEGIQAQPLILNIPQSAINPVQQQQQHQQKQKKKKRPQLTASAVPLLAEASLMDIFQPPQIPPSRTGSANKPSGNQPVLIGAKPVKAASSSGAALLPTRIRPGTIVEKAPAMASDSELKPQEASEQKEQEMKMPLAVSTELPQANKQDQEFILVGDDNEPGLSRHVQPAYGDARYVPYGDFHPYFDLLHQNRRFALRKSGRALEPQAAEGEKIEQADTIKEEQTKEEPIKEAAKEEPVKEEPVKEQAELPSDQISA
ncbi:misshapen-like kinase 1 [Drosophila guanche]|uniref:Uncharacterized protein n=1 Tax=Drosophila guanche TaxID=7266 RepID=A0A3B0KRJ2_DROGU|nr:misshapen-like kinase 1 [Drosophila guanche]SPP88516.1 Hypothetical predicted protein [Drosophila guanche]